MALLALFGSDPRPGPRPRRGSASPARGRHRAHHKLAEPLLRGRDPAIARAAEYLDEARRALLDSPAPRPRRRAGPTAGAGSARRGAPVRERRGSGRDHRAPGGAAGRATEARVSLAFDDGGDESRSPKTSTRSIGSGFRRPRRDPRRRARPPVRPAGPGPSAPPPRPQRRPLRRSAGGHGRTGRGRPDDPVYQLERAGAPGSWPATRPAPAPTSRRSRRSWAMSRSTYAGRLARFALARSSDLGEAEPGSRRLADS